MSEKRKHGPIRQLSLQTEIRTRPILKKQLSVEQLDAIDEHRPVGRGVESAKNKLSSDRPRSVKVAWGECRQGSRDDVVPTRFTEPVEVRKCKEHKRPTTAKLRPQSSLEKDSILYTRQELAERLRKAWKDREENKQNLDIFLTHNVQEKHADDELEENDNYYEYEATKRNDTAVIGSSGNRTDEQANNLTNKSVHKAVVKSKSTPANAEFSYIPSTTSSRPKDVRTNISVTIPSVLQSCKPMYQPDSLDKPDTHSSETETSTVQKEPERKEAKLVKQTSLINKENENSFKNLPPRPMTAAAKREGFQKRTNTAFNGSLSTGKEYHRPPLTRTLSVPVKASDKPKFIATKRRLKPARRKEKDYVPENNSEDECNEGKGKKGVRCKSAPGGELVTMVSLVSPAGSDTEEVVDSKRPEAKGRNVSPVKSATSTSAEPPKTIQLRKTVKSVSFQQSSIHAVRSFSASFPSRRGSMAAALNSGTSLAGQQALPEREKRAPLETSPTENRGPKRRLVRNNSSGQPVASSFDDDITSKSEAKPTTGLAKQASVDSTNATSAETKADACSAVVLVKSENSTQNGRRDERNAADEEDTNTVADDDPETPKFETTKEKECWAMYKKMSEKGLPVAYDTILRGMLTPTEYRSIRKEVVSS